MMIKHAPSKVNIHRQFDQSNHLFTPVTNTNELENLIQPNEIKAKTKGVNPT